MNRLLLVAKTALCLAGTALLLCGCWLVIGVRKDAASVAQQSVATLQSAQADVNGTAAVAQDQLVEVGAAVDHLNGVLAEIERPCGGGQPCGTLADVAKTLNTARLTMGQIEIAANHEDRNLATLDAQETALYADTHAALNGLPPVEAQAASTLGDLDKLERDPQLTAILANGSSMTSSGARILKDGADEADKLAHPAKKKLTFWGGVWAGLEYVHKLLPPIF